MKIFHGLKFKSFMEKVKKKELDKSYQHSKRNKKDSWR